MPTISDAEMTVMLNEESKTRKGQLQVRKLSLSCFQGEKRSPGSSNVEK